MSYSRPAYIDFVKLVIFMRNSKKVLSFSGRVCYNVPKDLEVKRG